MQTKIAFIVPGFTDTSKDKRYWPIKDYFKEAGIEPIFIEVDWNRRVMSDYVKDFIKLYKTYSADKVYFFGFSFGAMICFIASAQVHVDTQILGSISSYFKEDLSLVPKNWLKYIGKKRANDFMGISAAAFTPKVIAKSIFLFGDKGEEVIMNRLNKHIYDELTCVKERYIIPGSGHDIGNKKYHEKIHEIIKNLN